MTSMVNTGGALPYVVMHNGQAVAAFARECDALQFVVADILAARNVERAS